MGNKIVYIVFYTMKSMSMESWANKENTRAINKFIEHSQEYWPERILYFFCRTTHQLTYRSHHCSSHCYFVPMLVWTCGNLCLCFHQLAQIAHVVVITCCSLACYNVSMDLVSWHNTLWLLPYVSKSTWTHSIIMTCTVMRHTVCQFTSNYFNNPWRRCAEGK